MTLEEAIEHAEKEVVKLEQKCEESCAQDHRQLVSWLKQLANPWIPVTERLPETDDYILISFSNYTLPYIGRYEIDAEGNGAFYPGDEAMSYASMGIFVNAWMPLPKPYRESEEQDKKHSSKMPEAVIDFIRRRFMTRQ